MKRKILALAAMAACAGTAHAQTSVTLYGVVDLGIEYVNRVATPPASPTTAVAGPPVGKRFDMPNQGGLSASRWGIRGTEDLGGGLKAFFTLESQFTTDNGNFTGGSGLFNRQALVGLGNEYGKLSFGKQYSSFLDGMVNFSPTRFAPAYEPGIWWVGMDYKPNNTVKYMGQFGGLYASAHYSFGAGLPVSSFGSASTVLYNGGAGETPGAFRDDTAYGASLMYLGKSFGASIAYDQWNPAATVGNPGKVRKAGVAGSYTTGPLKFMAGYRWGDQTYANGNTAMRDDYWFAGVNYSVTPALDLQVGYFYSDIKKVSPTNTGAPSNPANPQQVSFVVDYTFTKRTDVYFSAAWTHNGSLGNDGPFTLFLFNYPQAPGQKNMVGMTAGIRHIF